MEKRGGKKRLLIGKGEKEKFKSILRRDDNEKPVLTNEKPTRKRREPAAADIQKIQVGRGRKKTRQNRE